MTDDSARREAFVRAHAPAGSSPMCPELSLQLADDAMALWAEVERFEGREGLAPPFWAFAWAGGQAVARHLLDHPSLVQGRTVLDFATGGGVVAMAAARSGAAHVVATDVDPMAAAAVRLSAAANGLDVDVMITDVVDTDDGWDVVTAGDVCYERPMAERVLRWLRRLAERGATVLLGDPGRAYLPSDGLEPLATYDVPTPPTLEDRAVRRTTVHRVAGTGAGYGRSST